MTINIYDADTGELIFGKSDLRESFDNPDDNPEYDAALEALEQTGEYFVGGGAAPAWRLERVDDQ